MHLKPSHPPTEERDPRDAAQPWLDFGRWLAGEPPFDQSGWAGSPAEIPSFAGLAEQHFRDLAAYVPTGNPLELRRAMHRRFIRALHLAFGSESLPDLAARQSSPVFRLIEHLRADFDLLAEPMEFTGSSLRHLSGSSAVTCGRGISSAA